MTGPWFHCPPTVWLNLERVLRGGDSQKSFTRVCSLDEFQPAFFVTYERKLSEFKRDLQIRNDESI